MAVDVNASPALTLSTLPYPFSVSTPHFVIRPMHRVTNKCYLIANPMLLHFFSLPRTCFLRHHTATGVDSQMDMAMAMCAFGLV